MSLPSSSWSKRQRQRRALEPSEPTAVAQPGTISDASTPPGASVTVETGSEAGLVVPLSGTTSIGRSAENDITLSDETVSRVHAVIEQREDGYVVIDRESTNGSWMVGSDGRRRLDGEHPLADGDRVQFGPYRLLFTETPAREIRAAS